ncbi:MAG: universal stress protein [Bacteroidota bacterium]
MKKILVLTDLSENADHAALAAIPVSAKLNANILLLHTWMIQPVLADYPNASWGVETILYAEQSKAHLERNKENIMEQIALLDPKQHHASIDWFQEDGNVSDHVAERLKKGDIEMIIMGASAGSRLDHLLLGSDTYSVISNSNRPVLVVPPGQGLNKIEKVTFATDFNEADVEAVHYLTRIGRKLNFHLEILHVIEFGKDDSDALNKKNSFLKHVAKFDYPNISFENVFGKNIVNRLQDQCMKNNTDLLALSHDQHSFWNRLFKTTQSGELLKKQELPVLIIPATIKHEGI